MKAAGNVVWNWMGVAVAMLAGFVVAPFLVHRLGEAGYGLWILIASMTGYFGLLDLGIRGSVGRYIAYYRAREDQEGVNEILSTAVAILTGVAILAMLATLAAIPLFYHLFEIPPEHLQAAKWAVLIVGLNLAITFPVSVFDGVLWGHERFDLLNIVDIPAALVRMGLTFLLVRGPQDIVALAVLTLVVTVGSECAKMLLSFQVNPGLRVGLQRIRRIAAKQLYGYGVWSFLLSVSRQVNLQVAPLLIGSLLSVALVTPFSIAARLIAYAAQVVVSATGVFTPIATALHAREDHGRQQRLFLLGGQWCTAFAFYVSLLLLLLGESLLRLWIDHDVAKGAMLLLVILAIGESLPLSQWLTYSMILGMAKHRLSAIANLVEGAVAVTASLLLARSLGVVGVCLAFAAAGFLCRGVFQVVYGCHLVRMPVTRYLREAVLQPALGACGPALLLGAAVWVHAPDNWIELFIYGAGFSLLFAANTYWALGLWAYLPVEKLLRPRGRVLEEANVR